jgi:ABC-type spermidine/putrescine transport system permease subunit I
VCCPTEQAVIQPIEYVYIVHTSKNVSSILLIMCPIFKNLLLKLLNMMFILGPNGLSRPSCNTGQQGLILCKRLGQYNLA